MDLKALNFNFIYAHILPFITFISLCLILPFFYFFKFISSILRYFSMEDLKGKVILVTGASSGIGEQLAYAYAKKGASLVIVARRKSQLEKVAEVARALGAHDVLPICADVSNMNDCKKFIDAAINHFGQLDHLVNNAGIVGICTLEDATDVSKFGPVMDVNFWGSVYPTYYAIPHLKKTKGKIIVNSSTAAYMHPPKMGFYSASKAALISFYETMRVELAPEISITTITLGFIESEMSQGKHLTKDGAMEVSQKAAAEVMHGLPVMSASACAEAIVCAARKGERNVTEPSWFRVLFLLKTLCPELVDWYIRRFYYKPSKDRARSRLDSIPVQSRNKMQ